MTENTENFGLQADLLRQVTESNKDREINIVIGSQYVFKDHSTMEQTNITSRMSAEEALKYRQTKKEAEEEINKRKNEPGFEKSFSQILQHLNNKVETTIIIYQFIKCVDLDTLLNIIVNKLVATGYMTPQAVMSSDMIKTFQYFSKQNLDFSIDNYRKRITPRLEALRHEKPKEMKSYGDKGGSNGNAEA